MKQCIKNTMVLVAMAAMFFSFTPLGGEGFEILLNNKVVVQKFGKSLNDISSLRLTKASEDDQLIIKYHRCGASAKNRTITVKDAQNKILKEWHLKDAVENMAMMECKVKDILSLKKNQAVMLKLYYSSSQ